MHIYEIWIQLVELHLDNIADKQNRIACSSM